MSEELNQLNQKLSELDDMRDKLVDAIRSAQGNYEPDADKPDRVMVGKRKAKTFAEWMEFKKTNERQYQSGANQARMAEDREALGYEAFYKKKS